MKNFWARGVGRSYALGAMYSSYNLMKDALDIAKIGVKAACEYDEDCGLPMKYKVINVS